ncbi:proline--tRNA ligase [Candidatus Legionella polyplacis]|uniref:Proline--tRNA ligase n=1 Tax=Candidatus Legionella polyplacis TaxID=2005262 RepID=A0ABZ2GWY8_9GAMM
MRISKWFLSTNKNSINNEENISYQLMIKSGIIRKISTGLYTWMPLGLKILQKIKNLIRQEMNKNNAIEILMPILQPSTLWKKTGRWNIFGNQLMKLKDNRHKEYCLSPTHEEIITKLIKHELKSYKQLPIIFYQIQNKFRNEIRPRFGTIRTQEFIMKDAYSFHLNNECLKNTYKIMRETYCNILNKLKLNYRIVKANNGNIGGDISHEFQILTNIGEDIIIYSNKSNYAANLEQATDLKSSIKHYQSIIKSNNNNNNNIKTNKKIFEITSNNEMSIFFKAKKEKIIKTFIVEGKHNPFIALILKENDELNLTKAEKHPLIKSPIKLIKEKTIKKIFNTLPCFLGPINLKIPIIVDYHALMVNDFICGANEINKFYLNVKWGKDVHCNDVYDLRKVQVGDLSPDGKGKLKSCKGIEIAHIFQIGNKYSKILNAKILNKNHKLTNLIMGCYGFGVSRIIAAIIEQFHDANGIIWPFEIAPFQIVIIPINAHQSNLIKTISENIYEQLIKENWDVLLDDRNEKPGILFMDHDLIGIPHHLIISYKNIKNNLIEYKSRKNKERYLIPINKITQFIKTLK